MCLLVDKQVLQVYNQITEGRLVQTENRHLSLKIQKEDFVYENIV